MFASSCATRSSPSQPDLRLLHDLAAEPRPTGGGAIAAARERCVRELREIGYDVVERPFEFSEFPGRFGTPLVGAAAAAIVGAAGGQGAAGQRIAPVIAVTAGGLALFLAVRWLLRRGVLAAPVLRARGINLEARRPGAAPAIWLSAHLDTKSQPIPTLVRSAGIIVESIGLLLTATLSVIAAFGASPHPFYWGFAAAVTLVGAVPVVLSMVGSRSPGALDNASGVATVIAAARQLGNHEGLGILITDAEELGLAGARAWTPDGLHLTVLNCDGVDDDGAIQVMFTGRRPTRILDAVQRASEVARVPAGSGRLFPGVLTDSVAFADQGLESVTFSRGSLRSLARVHSRRDNVASLRGTGIAETALLIVATVRQLGEMR